jgi:hypothetical protein
MNGEMTGFGWGAEAIPQGWYPDPLEPADVRWWTGQEWTHHVQPRPAASALEAVGVVGVRA